MSDEPKVLVIPAGGLGTRLRPVNPDLPKEMLPIGSKPAIQYTVEEGMDAGIESIVIIINSRKEIIRDHLSRLGYPIMFLYQAEPRGEMDAIALAEPIVGNQAAAVFYPDNLHFPAPGALKLLKSVFQQQGTDVMGLTPVTQENAAVLGNSGRVDVTPLSDGLYQIKRFHPKGPGYFHPRFPGELRACGMTVYGQRIFETIRRARKLVNYGEFTDGPVRRLILKERGWLGFRLPGRVYDVGNPDGYRLCAKQDEVLAL